MCRNVWKKTIIGTLAGAIMLAILPAQVQAEEKGAIILYTNDVHCAIDDYSQLAAYSAQLEEEGHEVMIVDAGDAIQGEVIGTLTGGSAIIDIMNEVGYDYAVPGNHEFDYGMETFLELTQPENSNFEYLSSNFIDLRTNETVFESYDIVELNGEKVAFVGIATPESYTKSTPAYFQDENGNIIYGFAQDAFYETIQNAVNEAKENGADRVVAVGHLGIDGTTEGWKSTDVIANTNGIDVFIDAHTHEVIPGAVYENMDGEDVLLSSTGSKFENFGCLTLNVDGTETTELIDPDTVNVENSEAAKAAYENVQTKIDEYNSEIEYLYEKIGTTEVELTLNDPDSGEWVIRTQETNMGDFVADAYREMTGADVALANGGGIRAAVAEGDVTRKALMDVNPWNNAMCVISATGQQLLDALEHSARLHPTECGGFMHVSGMTYEIHNYIESPVILDENGSFKEIDETKERRIANVKIGGVAIDPDKEYTVAGNFYMLKQGGDGFTMFMDAPIVKQDGLSTDADMLIQYFTETLNGKVTKEQYGNLKGDGRITICSEPGSADMPYVDVAETEWYYESVRYAYENKIMIGLDETHFGPNRVLSRGQFALILYRMEGEPEVSTEKTFTDITGDEWYGEAVLWAQETGVVTGYADGSFGPEDMITREQMAVMMYRYAKYKGYDVSTDGDYTTFDDYESVSGFAKRAMDWVVGLEIIRGKHGNNIAPAENTTRAEAAAILQRFMCTSFVPAPEYELPGIVKEGTAVDADGVLTYVSNAAIEDNLMQEIYLFQDKLLVSASDGTTLQFELLSLETGEVLHEATVSLAGEYNYSYNVQICGDKIAVADALGGKIYILDETLKNVNEYDVTGDYVYVNTALTEAYSLRDDSGIQKINLETGDALNLLYNVHSVHPFPKNKNSVTFTYKDGNTGASCYAGLDFVSGKVEILDLDEGLDAPEYSNEEWLGMIQQTEGMQYLVGRQSNPKKLILDESSSLLNLLGEPNRIMDTLISRDTGCELILYDMKGLFLSSVTLKDVYMGPTTDPVWVESANGYFFTIVDDTGHDQLYFWDLSKSVDGEHLKLTDFESEPAVSQELYDRAAQIGEAYGVVINIADRVRIVNADHIIELEFDEEIIAKGLDWVESLLADYPTGFFEQLPCGAFSGKVEINLTGQIERSYGSNYSVAGFVSDQSGYYGLTISLRCDTSEAFASTFYHETSHIIDRKLQYDAEQGNNDLYSEEGWAALNPEGFEYEDSYETQRDYLVEYLPYFFDSYSLTFATEDRARIFQNAMIDNDYYFNTTDYYGRNAKLDYYSECIRASFDTTGWPETTMWEQALIDCDTAEPPFTGKG